MFDQLLQAVEGDPRGDVEASVVHHPDLVMFDGVSGLTVPDRQRVASCTQTRRHQRTSAAEMLVMATLTCVNVLLHPLWSHSLGS